MALKVRRWLGRARAKIRRALFNPPPAPPPPDGFIDVRDLLRRLSVEELNRKGKYDRLIVITDEQAHDTVPAPNGKGYVINVASYKNGVGYGKWTHIDGWSESVIDYIRALEQTPWGN